MEFKVSPSVSDNDLFGVLIESDWNLKLKSDIVSGYFEIVLIESDWNLKYFIHEGIRAGWLVLIESDWNLKKLDKLVILAGYFGINRIRLEFKVF